MTKTVPIISGAELQASQFRLVRITLDQHTFDWEAIRLHRHDCFEIFWITSGCGKGQIDFKKYSFKPNTLCLIPPGQMHGWMEQESDEPLSGYLLIFSKDMLTEHSMDKVDWSLSALFHSTGENPFYSVNSDQAAVIHQLFHLLEREQDTALKNREAAVYSYIQLLLIEIGRIQDVWKHNHREEAGFRLTKQYLALVETHFQKGNSMSEYASMLHVTTNHLIESVKRTLGKSAGEVLQDRQLLEAKRLLRYTTVTVNEIAQQLSFSDPSYFGRLFKKKVGQSPTEFRKQS